MSIRLFLAALATAALTGCATPQALQPTVVQVPVTLPCVQVVPRRPDLIGDKGWEKMNEFERTVALFADRAILKAHVGTLEDVLAACKG